MSSTTPSPTGRTGSSGIRQLFEERRARDRLYIAGWQTRQSPQDACWYGLCRAGLGGCGEVFEFDTRGLIGETEGWSGRGLRLVSAQTAPPVTERIIVTLDALDFSSDPGDQVNKFKDAISQEPYFKTQLGKTNDVRLTNLAPPQVDPSGKASVVFTLQCTYPDRTR